MNESLDQKIVNNAVSAYFFLGPVLLLCLTFNKWSKYINHSFVRGHAQTSTVIILAFWLIFYALSYVSILWTISLFWYDFYYITRTVIALCVFACLVYGAFKAHQRQEFSVVDLWKLTHTWKYVQLQSNTVKREQDKTILVLSFIPFVGYMLYPRYEKHATIRSVNKINLYSFLIIIYLYVSGHNNFATLLLLLYIIYATYTAIQLYANNKIKVLNLENIWSVEEMYIRAKALTLYLYEYTKRSPQFREYSLYLKIERAKVRKQQTLTKQKLETKKDIPFPAWLLYIPFINLIGLKFLDSKYKTHIINGMVVNLLLIWIWLLTWFNNAYWLFILFPISYGIANLKHIAYRFPVIYDIWKVQMQAWQKTKAFAQDINERRKTNKEVVFHVLHWDETSQSHHKTPESQDETKTQINKTQSVSAIKHTQKSENSHDSEKVSSDDSLKKITELWNKRKGETIDTKNRPIKAIEQLSSKPNSQTWNHK